MAEEAGFQVELKPGTWLRLVRGDITQAEADAIVNAANAQLRHGGGVARAIVRRGGEVIQRESDAWVRRHGPISPERPAITSGGSLPCRFVIHVVGPIWGEGEEDTKLRQAVTAALALADEFSLRSLALPAISTGIYGFPKNRAARVLFEALADYFASHPDSGLETVEIVLYDQPTWEAFVDAYRTRWKGTSEA